MALSLKILAAGTVATTTGTLYPSAIIAGKTALVKNIILVNTGAATATVNLYVQQQASGTNIPVSPQNLQLPAGQAFVLDDELTLYVATGPDKVLASATGSTVQFTMNGFERDI